MRMKVFAVGNECKQLNIKAGFSKALCVAQNASEYYPRQTHVPSLNAIRMGIKTFVYPLYIITKLFVIRDAVMQVPLSHHQFRCVN